METVNMQEATAEQQPCSCNHTMREKLVGNIMYYSQEEFEERKELFKLACESEEQLVDRLISILDYYYDQAQESNS